MTRSATAATDRIRMRTRARPLPAHLEMTLVCARSLQQMEGDPDRFDAGQYRLVARRLAEELARVPLDAVLLELLEAFPAAAEIHENLQYERRGLSRAPRALSRSTETQAAEVLMLAQLRARHWR